MSPAVALLTNPLSRANRKDPALAARLAGLLGETGEAHLTGSPGELPATLSKILQSGCDLLAVNGGDGTLSHVLTELLRLRPQGELPRLLLLRGGTMNVVAGTLGRRSAPEAALRRALRRLQRGRPLPTRRLPLLQVNGRAGFIFGNGCFYRFIDAYARDPSPARGLKMLAHSMFSALTGGPFYQKIFPPYRLRLTCDGAEQPTECLRGLGVSTIRHIGFGFRPFCLAERGPAAHVLLLKEPVSGVLPLIPRLYFGWRCANASLQSLPATDILLQMGRAEPYMMDGELFPAESEIRISAGRSAEFVIP